MHPKLPTADAVDNSASIQPARSLFISWGKTVQISGATSALKRQNETLFYVLSAAASIALLWRETLKTLHQQYEVSETQVAMSPREWWGLPEKRAETVRSLLFLVEFLALLLLNQWMMQRMMKWLGYYLAVSN
jgi:hypothetical protein